MYGLLTNCSAIQKPTLKLTIRTSYLSMNKNTERERGGGRERERERRERERETETETERQRQTDRQTDRVCVGGWVGMQARVCM